MRRSVRAGLATFGVLAVVAGLGAELSEVSVRVEDLGLGAIVGGLTLLASNLPALWAGEPYDADADRDGGRR
jgi:hypothetical protein